MAQLQGQRRHQRRRSLISEGGRRGGPVRTGHVLVTVAYLIAFALLAGTVGRVGVKKVLIVTTRADEPGPTVATAVVIILAGAVTTAALGMEPIFSSARSSPGP